MKEKIEYRQIIIRLLRVSRNSIFSTLKKNRSINMFPTHSFWFITEKSCNNKPISFNKLLATNTNVIVLNFDRKLFSVIKSRQKRYVKSNTRKFQNFTNAFFLNSQVSLVDILLQIKACNLFFALVNLLTENIFGNFVSFLDLINGVYRSYSFLNHVYKHLEYNLRKICYTLREIFYENFNSFRSFFLFYFLIFTRMQ